jgi:hypothetical protein
MLTCRAAASRKPQRRIGPAAARQLHSGAVSSPPSPQRLSADAPRTRTAEVNSQTCQCEKRPREMKNSPVQCRSAATPQKARVKAKSAAGIRSAAQASANVLWRVESLRFGFLRIRTRMAQHQPSYEATRPAEGGQKWRERPSHTAPRVSLGLAGRRTAPSSRMGLDMKTGRRRG